MRRIALFIQTLLCVCVCLGFAPSDSSREETLPKLSVPNFEKLPVGRVTRVLDENTLLIELDGKTQRCDLLGVSGASTERIHSALAIDALRRMLLDELVAVQYDPLGEMNIANRRAGYLYRDRDHLLINLELISSGYTRFKDSSMSINEGVFARAEDRARTLKLGIWDPNPVLPTPSDDPLVNQPPAPTATPQTTSTTSANDSGIVYITPYGTRYHRKDCPHLTDNARPTTRDKVKDSHKPCKTCKPDDP